MSNAGILGDIPASERPDAIYFLMIAGWREELRSNRWHWAKRWARLLPVVLVQPETFRNEFDAYSEVETRIQNTRILSVRSVPRNREDWPIFTALQASQIMTDAYMAGYKNPWLWHFSPFMAGTYALLPFRKKIMHLTEDWYLWPNSFNLMWSEVTLALKASDLIIAVSSGCAESASQNVKGLDPVIIENGCDFHDYSKATVDLELQEKGILFERIAVFGGNVDKRIDYTLLLELVENNPNTLFVIAGPLHDVSDTDRECRQSLIAKDNTLFLGMVEPERLADIYKTGHIGIIPFLMDELYVKSNFSLKLLEMASTGLPVLTTYMKSIDGLGVDSILVARNSEAFLASFPKLDRRKLKKKDHEELIRLAKRNDYDIKFEEAMYEIVQRHGVRNLNFSNTESIVREGLADQIIGEELQEYIDQYTRRPKKVLLNISVDRSRIAIPILTKSNRIGAEMIALREKAEARKRVECRENSFDRTGQPE